MKNLFDFEKLSNFCIYLVLVLINISYCPGIILTSNYKIIMTVIMVAIMTSLILNIWRNIILATSLYLYYGVFALLICSIVFLFYGVFIFGGTNNIFLTITCFLLGFCNYNHRVSFIGRCMKIYAGSALFLGLYSVYINLGSFIISEQYVFAVKNSSGVLLGTGIILCAFILNKSENKIQLIIWVLVMALLIICLLTFRCRTVIIAVFLSLLFFLHRKHLLGILLQRPIVLLSFIFILVLLSALEVIPINFIYDALFANKDISNLDSITSGRLSTYEYGMQIFSESPFLGNAILKRPLPPIDNFIISNLTYYGMVGAILMFPPYIFTWGICLKGLLKKSISDLYPFLILFLICITSFTEGPYPFGPGTPVVCAWFMLGWWYKFNSLRDITEIED